MAGRAAASRAAPVARRARRQAASDAALPPEFDADIYLDHPDHGDVRDLDEAAARAHYEDFGRDEGRVCSPIRGRADFIDLVPPGTDVLEIGPFCDPAFPRATWPNVSYMDALTTEQLRTRAAGLSWARPDGVPDIDYVWRGEPYADLAKRTFDVVYSSHVIEHTPCLIKHLREVGSILRPGGRYFLTIPDKRYCFDHYIPETTIGDVLDAFVIGRTNRHSARSLVNEALYHVHNDPRSHWTGDHWSDPKRNPITPETLAKLLETTEKYSNTDGYIDAHAWIFTPHSFRAQIDLLCAARVIPFVRERVYDTLYLKGEFYAVLRTGFPAAS